jgi:hypothetical protein
MLIFRATLGKSINIFYVYLLSPLTDFVKPEYDMLISFTTFYSNLKIIVLSRVGVCDYRRGMDWILGLLTTYTHHSERHIITALSLIYTLQFACTNTLGFSVFTSRILATDFNTVITTPFPSL